MVIYPVECGIFPQGLAPNCVTVLLQVGSQFVQQYYTVLHTSPRYLHRFYTDASAMTHSDGTFSVSAHNQKVSAVLACCACWGHWGDFS